MILPVVNHGNLRPRALVDGDDKSNLFAREPFAWIIIPLIVFATASLLLALIRHRRRRAWREAYASRQGAIPPGMNSSRGAQPSASSNARWQWVMTSASAAPPAGQQTGGIARRFGRGGYTREEGLNELGEAPPAYTPGSRNKPREHEDVELGDMTRPRANEVAPPAMSQTTPAPNATAGSEPSPGVAPPATGPVVAGPPTYADIQRHQVHQVAMNPVEQSGPPPMEPPRAVVRYG